MTFKSQLNPAFRSKFSEDIFTYKYRHDGCETWANLCKTLVEDVCGPFNVDITDDGKYASRHNGFMPKDERDQLIEYMTKMYFIPGGRYLYYAGRPNKYFNNCFSGDTKVFTDKGMKTLRELYYGNIRHKYMSPVDGTFKEGQTYKHGVQPLFEYTFVPIRGRSKIEYKVKATTNHKWHLTDGSVTENLKIGDRVPAGRNNLPLDLLAFLHGFIFGDGNRNGQVRLCADKDVELLPYFTMLDSVSVTYPESADGDPVIYCNEKGVKWKELPNSDESPAYIRSFIEGWIAADGHDNRLLCSVNREHLEWFRDNAVLAGLVVSGELREQVRDVSLGGYEYLQHSIFMQNFSKAEKWEGFKVKNIRPAGLEEVFCPYVPDGSQIIIDHNIHTGNCYLLRAEEDTREDWANLSWKAESCLMTGGGIGVDYSVYRAAGTPIHRTGGTASGPIPKMQMVNDIGRRVMQGGSRRSAIYASLRHSHADVHDFLVAKDWHTQPIGTSGLTYWDVKQQDFNFPAPLDMTNISVNYDTKWLMNYYETGDVGDVFRRNVEQALRTGEPGFSFNFFDKENETLRNACTEVTSSDDSDVCNLGSINLGRIEDVHTLRDVVHLATKFLVCGTLKAKLPYEKVAQVREKNRRLGLGLMGVHEWLIKRGYRYEVVPELHQWLSVYRGVSDSTSREYADSLSISRPVANRAIAPTGTIGILAGTSTGIEPIFAVAYKRRYLRNGTRWHYQYVVDSAAQELIDLYGVDPDKMESAIDLSTDFERRIRFQADVQDYVDMAISSTINLPAWGSSANNPDGVGLFTETLARYASRLRGFTVYPDGSRGGQPLSSVAYSEARSKLGEEFEEHVETHDICDISGSGGTCGV
jgi:ribonucleoside-diphosphate reductase alpha chain